MKKILWISPYAPYDNVRHAGGQIENYYLKGIHSNNNIDLCLISVALSEEYEKVKKDLSCYGITNEIIKKENIGKNNSNFFKRYNKYAGITEEPFWQAIEQSITNLCYKNPDVIILQWTECVLFSRKIRNIFPNSKIVLIEEDVSFLKYKRRIRQNKNILKKTSWFIRYIQLKRVELRNLREGDLIILNNDKDKKLVEQCGVKHTWRWSPFFHSGINQKVERNLTHDLLFFGAMDRDENYESCIWFIENVMGKLGNDFRFIIVGNKPNERLLKFKSERIVITGFVDNIKPYFENTLCLVAPLVAGAGIKVKILEAMSFGLTVLTNHIGIEGIPAINNHSYIHCEEAMDYVDSIKDLADDNDRNLALGRNGQNVIKSTFNYEKDIMEFQDRILKL